jgi:hypothetical protein
MIVGKKETPTPVPSPQGEGGRSQSFVVVSSLGDEVRGLPPPCGEGTGAGVLPGHEAGGVNG